ncbi:MAG: hypothetical protein HY207_11115 [Nitrospirae bacterium]|nr:hypothetical protein [Nitrospirota bacterium]
MGTRAIPGWRLLVAGCVGTTLVAGCGNSNLFEGLANDGTTQATVEAARIDIDNGNYTAAIAALQALCGTNLSAPTCDAQTVSLLAAAYSGRAGLDVLDLIKEATSTASGVTGSFSTFSSLLPTLTASNKQDMHNAVTLLSGLTSRTANQNLQMAVVAAADLVVTVGVDLTNGFDAATGVPNVIPSLADVQQAETSNQTVTQVTNDLLLVTQGVTGSGLAGKDLTNDITQIQNTLDANQNGTVTAPELQSYLASL